jgi:hypothetical protein
MLTKFANGQRVTCINDHFHPSICEWGDEFPHKGMVYTVKLSRSNRDALTGEIGIGLLLEELSNPNDRLAFSEWRFEPLVACDEAEMEQEELHTRLVCAIL